MNENCIHANRDILYSPTRHIDDIRGKAIKKI